MQQRTAALIAAVVAGVGGHVAGPASAAELPITGTLDLRDGFDQRLDDDQRGARAGSSVAPAGDVNGDGLADLVVGARLRDAGEREDAGAAWVVFGKAGGRVPDPAAIGEQAGFRVDGAAGGDQAGFDVAAAGDVNGDGLGDVLVGAPYADAAGRADAGAAYVVYGKRGGEPVDLGALGAGGLAVAGAAPGDRLGFSVSSVPDLDGDGRGDLVLGAPGGAAAEPDGSDGAVVLFTPAPGVRAVDAAALGDTGYRIDGPAGDRAGFSVAALPDWNGDGIAEIAVGAPATSEFAGAAYVVWGKGTPAAVDLGALGAAGIVLRGGKNEWAGGTLAPAGDVDGDGVGDLAVGTLLAAPEARENAGGVAVVLGRATPGSADLTALGEGGYRIAGAAAGDQAGSSLAPAGDVNGDGRDDLLVGALFASPLERDKAGAAYVVFGPVAPAPPAGVDLALLGDKGIRLTGPVEGDLLGRSVAGIGDVNGDGRPDLAAGAPPAGPGGALLIVHGPPPPQPDPIEQLPPDPGAEEEVEEDGCHAAANVQAIVDDSGSMSFTDAARLRARALKLLVLKERNAGERFGAVEFGDLAEQLFPDVLLGGLAFRREQDTLLELIDERIQADGGSTNYNAGFAAAREINPDADAIVFLTDGEHNVDRYANGHRGGPRTFVVGLGIGEEGSGRRLQRIADETEGRYFPDVSAETLQPVLNRIDSLLNCDIDLETEVDRVADEGDRAEVQEPIEDGTHSSEVLVSWDDPRDRIEVRSLEVRAGRRVTRFGARKVARALRGGEATADGLRLAGRRGWTYASLRLLGVERGELRVAVRAARLKGREKERVTLQITQSRRRR